MAKTYQRTYKTLVRMLDRVDDKSGKTIPGIAKRDRDHVIGEPFLYWLKESPYDFHRDEQRRQHEFSCRELCVAYAPFVTWWDNGWTSFEKEQLDIGKYEFEYDRRMVLPAALLTKRSTPLPFVWEVDGSTEPIYDDQHRARYSEKAWRKSINGKLDKYVRFAKANPDTWFHVLFATYESRFGGKFGAPSKRANDIVELLLDRGLTRGQFLVTTVARAKADPLGPVFLWPGKPGVHSLRDV